MLIPLYRLLRLCERAVLDGGFATVSVAGKWGYPCLRKPKTPFSPLSKLTQLHLLHPSP